MLLLSREEQNPRMNIYNYLHELVKLRSEYPVLAKGKLRHIYPMNNLYLLVKYYEDSIAVIIINSSDEDIKLDYSMMKKFLPQAESLFNLKSHTEINLELDSPLVITKMNSEIFLVNKSESKSNKK